MGSTQATIKLVNTVKDANERKGMIGAGKENSLDLSILVDSPVIDLCGNEEKKSQLGLDLVEKTKSRMPDGSWLGVEIVGQVTTQFLNRQTSVNAIVQQGNVAPLLAVGYRFSNRPYKPST